MQLTWKLACSLLMYAHIAVAGLNGSGANYSVSRGKNAANFLHLVEAEKGSIDVHLLAGGSWSGVLQSLLFFQQSPAGGYYFFRLREVEDTVSFGELSPLLHIARRSLQALAYLRSVAPNQITMNLGHADIVRGLEAELNTYNQYFAANVSEDKYRWRGVGDIGLWALPTLSEVRWPVRESKADSLLFEALVRNSAQLEQRVPPRYEYPRERLGDVYETAIFVWLVKALQVQEIVGKRLTQRYIKELELNDTPSNALRVSMIRSSLYALTRDASILWQQGVDFGKLEDLTFEMLVSDRTSKGDSFRRLVVEIMRSPRSELLWEGVTRFLAAQSSPLLQEPNADSLFHSRYYDDHGEGRLNSFPGFGTLSGTLVRALDSLMEIQRHESGLARGYAKKAVKDMFHEWTSLGILPEESIGYFSEALQVTPSTMLSQVIQTNIFESTKIEDPREQYGRILRLHFLAQSVAKSQTYADTELHMDATSGIAFILKSTGDPKVRRLGADVLFHLESDLIQNMSKRCEKLLKSQKSK